MNFDKFIIMNYFFSYILNTNKISRWLKADDYVINKMFKFQAFVV